MTDLYEVLQIKPNASENEIKKAYYTLSKLYHPDKSNDPNACRKFQEINSAYNMLMDERIRKNYTQLNKEEKNKFQSLLEKIFTKDFKIDEIKSMGFSFNKKDWDFLEKNYLHIFNNLNFRELFDLLTKGIIPNIKKQNNNNCSDSDINCWDELQAEYYYDLPIYFQQQNKIDIRINLNLSLNDLIDQNKKKIKIKRNMEDEELVTNFVFNLEKPYVVYYGGGDMDDGEFGNLIIQLVLPKNFHWKDNLIIYEYPISLYQMVYGLDIELDFGKNIKIEYKDYVPSRDGFLITVDKINIINHCFAIKLILNYEHSDEKEDILKIYFNLNNNI
jgi:DnaJ-class molecular chaperone